MFLQIIKPQPVKKIVLFFIVALSFSCHKDKINNDNPYLPNYSFSMDINKTLPTYSDLQFASKGVRVYPPNGPTKGVIVFNTGSGYNAYDGGCPNENLTTCSTLSISGINAVCQCDNAIYNLFTGQCPGKSYSMKVYRTEVIGDIIRVSN